MVQWTNSFISMAKDTYFLRMDLSTLDHLSMAVSLDLVFIIKMKKS
jgi:hypothetical protein